MKKIYTLFRFSLILIFSLTVFSKNSSATFKYKSTRIISLPGDTLGTFVRISVPTVKRYNCGCPVFIYVCGGFDSNGMLGNMFNLSNWGFIVVEYNYPGGGSGTQKSGGTFDNRGSNCIIATRDVMKYALGQIPDRYGKYLNELTGTKTPLYNNVGVIGGSNGGCMVLATLGQYGSELNSLAWISFFESPIGDGMQNADAGKPYGKNVYVNQNGGYDNTNGQYDWGAFRYAADSIAFISKKDTGRGLFYFDVNDNNVFNRGIDYDLLGRYNSPYSKKYFYSVQVVRHAYQMGYYPLTNPSIYFADSTSTKNFWGIRNGEEYIAGIVANIPNIKVLFMVRDSDHITCAPNHPEAVVTLNKFQQAGCNWYKVNPDRSYTEYVSGLSLPTAADANANAVVDNMTVRDMLMLGNIFPDRYSNHYATALEMADRVMNNNWSVNLSGLLSVTCPAPRLEDEESDDEVSLYPNPSSTEVNIQINAADFGTATIRVFDVIGREVMMPTTITVDGGFNLTPIDISNLSAGNYFVRVDAPGFARTLQFTRE